MTLRWGMKIVSTFYPKGTPVRQATLEEVRSIWPAIEASSNSNQVAVWFPDMAHPTIIQRSEVLT